MAENQQPGNTITLTNEQFATLLQQIQISAANVPAANIAHLQGNFSRCTSRFDGNRCRSIHRRDRYVQRLHKYFCRKRIERIPILLTSLAATWWQNVKNTVNTWDTAIELLRQTYGSEKPVYRIYKKLFSRKQENDTLTDIFVSKARALLSKLPYNAPLPESMQIDIV